MTREFVTQMSVWRIKHQKQKYPMGMSLELVQQEKLPHIYGFHVCGLFISDKYIVSQYKRPLAKRRYFSEMIIEVRSAVDFTLIYMFPPENVYSRASKCFYFFNDVLAISILSAVTARIR